MVWLPSFLLIKTTFTASLALKNVLDTVAQSSYPEMLSLDLISVMFLSPDLSSGLQVCLSGSSSCAHPFIIVAALCLTPPLLFISDPSCSFFYLCGFRDPLYPQISVFIRCLLLSSIVTTRFLHIIRASLWIFIWTFCTSVYSLLYLTYYVLYNFVFLVAPTRILWQWIHSIFTCLYIPVFKKG